MNNKLTKEDEVKMYLDSFTHRVFNYSPEQYECIRDDFVKSICRIFALKKKKKKKEEK